MDKKIYQLLIFIFLLTVFISSASNNKEYLLIEIYYENGNFFIVNKSLEYGNYPVFEHDAGGGYEVKLVSDKGVLVYSSTINPTLLFSDGFDGENIEGGAIELERTSFFIIAPSKDADKIEIFKDNKKIFEEEVYDAGAVSCRIE